MKSFWKSSLVLFVSLIGLNSLNVSGDSVLQFNDLETICIGIDLGFLEDPRRCTGFILCIFGLPSEITCPPTSPVYDPNRQICVEGNPDTCEIFGQTPVTTVLPPTVLPTEPPQTIPPPPTPPPLTTEDPGTEPPPTFPPIGTDPPITLPPSTELPGTDPPHTIPPSTELPGTDPPPTIPPATELPGTDPPPTIPPTTTLPPPQNVCQGNNLRFVADPAACYRYFWCFFNIPIAGECEVDRIFLASLQGCVRGDRETCTRTNNIINVIIRPNSPN